MVRQIKVLNIELTNSLSLCVVQSTVIVVGLLFLVVAVNSTSQGYPSDVVQITRCQKRRTQDMHVLDSEESEKEKALTVPAARRIFVNAMK